MCEKNLPVFMTGTVFSKYSLPDKPDDIFYLQIESPGWSKDLNKVPVGQFFMLRKKGSKHLLGRPISISGLLLNPSDTATQEGAYHGIEFTILKKGGGTTELSGLKIDDEIEILGPLGNGFPLPDPSDRVCLVSGGVGVAPIADFAYNLYGDESLFQFHGLVYNLISKVKGSDPVPYDYYACFKSHSYGLEYVSEGHLTIATEDGSEGTKGMLPAILTAETLKEKSYTVVYACGPTPMLKYVQSICQEAGVKSYFSMENRMACGVGACLGCTIKTTEGNKRCCKDGPVFPGDILIFDDVAPRTLNGCADNFGDKASPDLAVKIAGVEFKNPVIAASGTFGYGTEYEGIINPDALGGVCSKGLTIEPRPGNHGIRVYELSDIGMMNSIGLENPGIEHFIEHELPTMLAMNTVTIVNLSGSSMEAYTKGAKLLNQTNADMIELNISCPNVKAGGMAFGMTPEAAESITLAIKEVTNKPLIVKLTPNAPHLVDVALAVKSAGADAISLVNTFQALAINIETGKPVFDNVCAGYSGPGIKPIALRMVYDVAKAIRKTDPDYPIIGLGGIATWQDTVEFIMAGATAIQVGTATFGNPNAMTDIITGIQAYMERKNFRSLADFRGIIL